MGLVSIESYLAYVVAALLAIILYLVSNTVLFRHIMRILEREILIVARIATALLSISLFLAVIASLHGVHEIFVLVFSLFLISFLAVIIGARHVLEEYMTGLIASKTYDLRPGDYIEVRDIRGYIAALDEASIVVRDSRRGLVYIPYTLLVHMPFKRVKSEEMCEVRITFTVPINTDLESVKSGVEKIASELGVESPRVDIDEIGLHSMRLVLRGYIRDPRREEEVRLAIMDRLYLLLRPSTDHIEKKSREEP